ncbi:MAG TPA: type II secretion system F family protein [Candidatus Dormibacteraeota bacterium]|nr:type II secretion system F family protein [Candidatus Dormibacteraeota bacterium]
MPYIVLLVGAAAAIGVGLVVFGIVNREASAAPAYELPAAERVTYRTLADVREQLRRRFEPTGTPVWIAANQTTNPLAADLASADLQLRPYEFRLLQVAVALVFALIAFLRFNLSVAVPVFAVIGYVAPALYLRNRRGRRLRKFEAGLPRAMELIANSMKAGQSVSQSLSAVTENAGPPVSEEFGLARREVELGASVESALTNMVKRMGSSDLRLVVMVITIQHSIGGDLPAILITLADTMRQRAEMREEILSATAQSRASSLIITLLPLIAAAFLYFVVPEYFRPMFVNPIGWVILAFAAGLLLIGNVIIRRITAIA